MKKTIKDAKKAVLAALDAIESEDADCSIQVMAEDEKVFREALRLPEVQVKIKEKKATVDLLISTPETLLLMIKLRVLGLSLIIAAEHLEQMTKMPQAVWLKTFAGLAAELMDKNGDQAATAMQLLKVIDFDEADFVRAISGWKSKR